MSGSYLDADTDLDSQLEDLLDAVWKAEADWRLTDRIDLATRTSS